MIEKNVGKHLNHNCPLSSKNTVSFVCPKKLRDFLLYLYSEMIKFFNQQFKSSEGVILFVKTINLSAERTLVIEKLS